MRLLGLALMAVGMMQDANDPVWVEAERPSKQAGSRGPDKKSSACGLQVLGNGWGAQADHFAEYTIELKADSDASIFLRYARALPGDAVFDVLVDGTKRGALKLASTGGWGDRPEEFAFARLKLGEIKAGPRRIRLQATADRSNANLDGFFVAAAAPACVADKKAMERLWDESLPANLREAARIRPEDRTLAIKPSPIKLRDQRIDLPDRLRRIASKPSPYLVKAYDAGAPIDFDRDVAWHSLQKEKDPRFFFAQAGKIGVIDLVSNVSLVLDVPGKAEITAHLIDALIERVVDGGLSIEVAFFPVFSDTLLVLCRLKNDGEAREVPVRFQARRASVELMPRQDYGYGATTTTGRLRWLGRAENTASLCFTDWKPDTGDLLGSMLCTIVSSEKAIIETQAAPDYSAELGHSIKLGRGETRQIAFAANLRRFGSKSHGSTGGMELYAVENDEEAVQCSYARAIEALNADWPKQFEASVRRALSIPVARLPERSWELDLVNCFELPLASTYNKCRQMAGPFYNFCRVHAVEPYGWWSYGMHAHESLSTFVVNPMRPELSQQWLLSHFALMLDDGELPYGVSPKGRRKQEAWGAATAPFLPWEAWTAYTYSGNKEFLELAFEASCKNHDWWLSQRTREGVSLQHWLNFMETVRDDQDLDTWTATGGAENQEALDLNCYLLLEERVLERMARELGRPAQSFADMAARRTELMQKHFWNAKDGVFYGADLKRGRPVAVKDLSTFLPLWAGLANAEQASSIVALLRDKQTFGTEFPIATLAKNEKGYSPQGHWHGSNWVETSLLVMQGLRQYGLYEEAARLAEINCRMVFQTLEKTGHFREYYNTETGRPVDLTDYIWSSLPAAMILEIIFGIRPAAEGVWIMPALPPGWDEIAIDNVCVRGKKLNIAVRRARAGSVRLNGHPAAAVENRGLFVKWSDLEDSNSIAIDVGPLKDVLSAPTRPRIAE